MSRLYYALDLLAFSEEPVQGKKRKRPAAQVHARFHGFVENMNSDRPIVKAGRLALPDYAINPKWKAKGNNSTMATSVWTAGDGDKLAIEDVEIHAYDLEALNKWADDEDES